MRIIAGAQKGRHLNPPKWDGLRPTSDKLRETLFNIVAPRIAGAKFLDVCAGTGAVGLEALSRGAARTTFLESDRRAVRLIQENAELIGLEKRCIIIRDTAEHALRGPLDDSPFELIVLDPPYEFEPLQRVLASAVRHVAVHGQLILEHAKRRTPPAVEGLRMMRTVVSGDSALSFYEP
jgi:16S rRNA (guanine966-N2)-methyltransferase